VSSTPLAFSFFDNTLAYARHRLSWITLGWKSESSVGEGAFVEGNVFGSSSSEGVIIFALLTKRE
jgi:hypothetical protein